MPAVYCCTESSPTITNCTIIENSADDGAGIFCAYSSSPTLTNCTISGNLAYFAGSVYCDSCSSPTITNRTISGNSADYGGGVYCHEQSSPAITNCVLWNDTPQEIHVASGSPIVTYCDIQGGWVGEGNIDTDPLFVDPDGPDSDPSTWEDNDYRLSAGSPCVDAGDNTAVPPDTADLDGDSDTSERTPLDLDFDPRLVDDPDTDDSGVADPPDYPDVVEMGAYEFQVAIPGDVDGDGDVDLTDLASLLSGYGCTGGGCPGDIDGDGDTDLTDLAILLAHYGEGP
jgi:parallel beta-helix repeat protein